MSRSEPAYPDIIPRLPEPDFMCRDPCPAGLVHCSFSASPRTEPTDDEAEVDDWLPLLPSKKLHVGVNSFTMFCGLGARPPTMAVGPLPVSLV